MLTLFVSLRLRLAGAACLRVPWEAVAGEAVPGESLNGSISRSFLLSLLWLNLMFVGGFLVAAALLGAWILHRHRSAKIAAYESQPSSVIERLKELERPQ